MVKKYNVKLDEIRENWQTQISGEDFNANLKNLIGTLGICFEDILEKLSELLTKLKNFNTAHFHQLTNKGVVSTFSQVLSQNHQMHSFQILQRVLGLVSDFRAGTAALRLA